MAAALQQSRGAGAILPGLQSCALEAATLRVGGCNPCVSEAAILRMQVPLCPGHRERCHLRTVKKAGPNKGRQFYTCPRAEGPAEQLESNCGYFLWQSDRIAQLKRKAASEAKA